ncbi:MAG: MarR family transcriptional regulator, partial [Panacibacter sp.]
KKDARHKVVTFTAKGEKLLMKIEPVWNALQQSMDELANESSQSKKLLQALTAFENNLKKESILERVEKKLP